MFVRDLTNYPLAVAVDDLGTGFGLSVDAVAPADPRQVCALLHTAAANLVTALEEAPATPLHAVAVGGASLSAAEREQSLDRVERDGSGIRPSPRSPPCSKRRQHEPRMRSRWSLTTWR